LCNTSSESADIYAKVDFLCSKTELHRMRSSKWGVHHLPRCHQCVPTDLGGPTKTSHLGPSALPHHDPSPLPQAGSAARHQSAQPAPTSTASPALSVPLTSPISSQLSLPGHMAGTSGSHIQEEMQAVSNPHFTPACAKHVHGKDLAVIHSPALCLHLLCPRESGDDSAC